MQTDTRDFMMRSEFESETRLNVEDPPL